MKAPTSNSSHLKKHRSQLKVMIAIAALLSPVYLAVTSTVSLAQTTIVNSQPDGYLQMLQGTRANTLRWIWKNPSQIRDPKLRQSSIAMSSVSLSNPNQRLLIPSAGTTSLQVKNSSSSSFGMTVAGKAEYWYLCSGSTGNFTLAWSHGRFNTSPCRVFKVRSGKLVQAKLPTSEITAFQPVEEVAKVKQIDRFANPAAFGKTFYCSTASQSTSAWGFHASNDSWNLLSPTDACAQAAAECQRSTNGTCQVVNLGERSVIDNNLTASLQCDGIAPGDPRFTVKGLRGDDLIPQLEALKSKARASGSGACLLNVTAPDELNLSPAGGLLDSANVYEVGSNLVVIGLTGSVLVSSTQVPQGVRVTAGDVYIYDPRQPSLPNSTENRYGRCPADASRFFARSSYISMSYSPSDSEFDQGKQLESTAQTPARQDVVVPVNSSQSPSSYTYSQAQGSTSDGNGSSRTPFPWEKLLPGIIRILTPPPQGSPQSPEPPSRKQPDPPRQRTFTIAPGGTLCNLPPDPSLRQQIITTSPSISAFLAETNWAEPFLNSAYATAIAQQFLDRPTGISQGGQ